MIKLVSKVVNVLLVLFATGGKFTTGAVAGASGEVASPYLSTDRGTGVQQAALIGGIASLAAGGEERDVARGSNIASSGREHNFLPHLVIAGVALTAEEIALLGAAGIAGAKYLGDALATQVEAWQAGESGTAVAAGAGSFRARTGAAAGAKSQSMTARMEGIASRPQVLSTPIHQLKPQVLATPVTERRAAVLATPRAAIRGPQTLTTPIPAPARPEIEIYPGLTGIDLAMDVLYSESNGEIKFQRWGRGDTINKPLPDGSEPSFGTVRSRYWKNRHLETKDTEEFSKANLRRMNKGLAPQDYNPQTSQKESRELHHHKPQREGGSHDPLNLREVTPDQHRSLDKYRR